MRLILIVLFSFLSSSAWGMGHLTESTTESRFIGKSAPDAILPRTDGTKSSVIASSKGKKVILVFWATWCPHCYEEIGTINQELASIEKKGIRVNLVDIGETKEDVQNYFDQRQLKLVSYVDGDSALQEAYHLVGVPTLVFIDEKGIVCNITHEFPSDYANYFSNK